MQIIKLKSFSPLISLIENSNGNDELYINQNQLKKSTAELYINQNDEWQKIGVHTSEE